MALKFLGYQKWAYWIRHWKSTASICPLVFYLHFNYRLWHVGAIMPTFKVFISIVLLFKLFHNETESLFGKIVLGKKVSKEMQTSVLSSTRLATRHSQGRALSIVFKLSSQDLPMIPHVRVTKEDVWKSRLKTFGKVVNSKLSFTAYIKITRKKRSFSIFCLMPSFHNGFNELQFWRKQHTRPEYNYCQANGSNITLVTEISHYIYIIFNILMGKYGQGI